MYFQEKLKNWESDRSDWPILTHTRSRSSCVTVQPPRSANYITHGVSRESRVTILVCPSRGRNAEHVRLTYYAACWAECQLLNRLSCQNSNSCIAAERISDLPAGSAAINWRPSIDLHSSSCLITTAVLLAIPGGPGRAWRSEDILDRITHRLKMAMPATDGQLSLVGTLRPSISNFDIWY